jgi:hypothetical protein
VQKEPRSRSVNEILARNRNKLLLFFDSFECGKNPTEIANLTAAKRRVTNAILDITPSHSNSSSLAYDDRKL